MKLTEELQERYFRQGITDRGKSLIGEYSRNYTDGAFLKIQEDFMLYSQILEWLFKNRSEVMAELVIKERLNG